MISKPTEAFSKPGEMFSKSAETKSKPKEAKSKSDPLSVSTFSMVCADSRRELALLSAVSSAVPRGAAPATGRT
jgi:hypothetical protein